jgi:hypothetical protein
MRLGTRCHRIVSSFAALCVLAAAGFLLSAHGPALASDDAADQPEETSASHDLSGRWQGRSYELARRDPDCSGTRCLLTLDIMKCASGWCGVEVLDGDKRCGATALKLDGGTSAAGNVVPVFRGTLELAKGTEPYVVEVYVVPGGREGSPDRDLQIAGDTGGEFRMFRRSFPFNATLARAGEPTCRPETSVSLLD